MKTLHFYLLRQVLATLALTVLVFTFVLLLGNVLKEIIALLVNRQATLGAVAHAVLLLIPFVLVFALPMGMLTAALLVFGRFSADQELTAVRASGISLISLVFPVILLSLLMSGFCAWFNLDLAPRCRVSYKYLLSQVGVEKTVSFLTEDRFVNEIPGYVIYVRKKEGEQLRDVRFYELNEGTIERRVSAPRGQIIFDQTTKVLKFKLQNAILEERLKQKEDWTSGSSDPEREIERGEYRWHPVLLGEFESDPIDLNSLTKPPRKPRISEMTFRELRAEMARLREQRIDSTPVQVELHRQVAFAFASFGFTLVGIPLAIRAHRRETNVGVAMALILLLAYYSFFILGESLENNPGLHPQLILWAPNFLFQAIGAWLLWRADRAV